MSRDHASESAGPFITGPRSDRSHRLVRETLSQVGEERQWIDARTTEAVFAWIETAMALRRELVATLQPLQLSEAKFCALTVLWRLQPERLTAAQVAYHTGVSRSAMTDIVDQLVAVGWVQRERCAKDRRTVRLELSNAGFAIVDQAMSTLMQRMAELERGTGTPIEALDAFCRQLQARLPSSPDS